ncbi:MAG: CocE/NonD family hydrolase [Alphaproteobacteria bacterium]|nr:CocE/NonD family hydrolase [Alphaproteobacteria bacterium]
MADTTSHTRRVHEIANEWVPLADGTRLAARIWLPEDAAADPVPGVIEYIPYRKRDGTAPRDALIHPYVAAHGYACVRVDIRGSGESDGALTDEYLPSELSDGCEAIQWIARQPWCTGAVGIIGNSWGGFNGLQIAALRPPALKAVITSCSTDDRYADDIHWMGGCLLNDNMKWASTMFAHNTRPPDPAIVGTAWRDMWMQRLDGSGLWIDTWLRHQRRDAFWKHGSVCEDFSAIQCPVFAVGGWNDGYSNAIPRLLAGLEVPRLAWIGQWAHRYPHMAAPGPAVGFLQEAVRWWDHWLKGRDTGMMNGPMLRAYIQDYMPPLARLDNVDGRWVGESTWPSLRIRMQRLHLNIGKLEASAGRETALTICSPEDVGLASGKWCGHGLGPDLPTDQRQDDAGSLVFETAPQEQRLELLGAPVAELELAADRPVAMVAVRLNDVAPDGAVTRLTYGLLNLTHRKSHEFPEAVTPGKRMRVRVQLNDIGQAIRPGHRLRLAVSTTYWPIAWSMPERVTLTIYTGASSLDLPVRPPDPGDERMTALPPAVLPPALKMTTLKEASDGRAIIRDVGRGESKVTHHEDAGTRRIDEIGLTLQARADASYAIRPDDPTSARAEVGWTVGMQRDGWHISSRTNTVLTSTRTDFRLRASLDAFEGDRRVFSRSWDSTIPRDHL